MRSTDADYICNSYIKNSALPAKKGQKQIIIKDTKAYESKLISKQENNKEATPQGK